jgi:hypothetical protein
MQTLVAVAKTIRSLIDERASEAANVKADSYM